MRLTLKYDEKTAAKLSARFSKVTPKLPQFPQIVNAVTRHRPPDLANKQLHGQDAKVIHENEAVGFLEELIPRNGRFINASALTSESVRTGVRQAYQRPEPVYSRNDGKRSQ